MTTASLFLALFAVAQSAAATQAVPPTQPAAAPHAAAPSQAQAPAHAAPSEAAKAAAAPPAACAPGQLAVTGYVKDRAGVPVPGAVVSLHDLDSHERRVVGTRASGPATGQFCSGALGQSKYQITVEKSGYIKQQEGSLDLRKAAAAPQAIDFVLYPDVGGARGAELFGVMASVIAFLASVWLARWYNVAWPNRGPLTARLESLRERVTHEPDPGKAKEGQLLLAVVTDEIKALSKWTFVDFLFWSRGQEQRAWMQIHDVEQRLVELMPDAAVDRLRARLLVVEGELRAIATPAALALANAAHETLTDQKRQPSAGELRAQISEALQFVHDDRDDKYWNLAVWQNKASWLLLAGAGMVVAVAIVAGRVPLLLAGAAGGLLSRLIRAQRAQDTPTDYGASWATLFFSPLLGALTGWFGVLLLVALNSLNVLGSVFANVSWDNVLQPMTLALALLMGISERFFDGLVAAAEQKTGVAKAAPTSSAKADVTVTLPAATPTGPQRDATDDGKKPPPPGPGRKPVETAVPHVEALKPEKAKVKQDVVATGYALAIDSVRKLYLVAQDGQALETTGLKVGAPGEMVFTVQDKTPAGIYRLKLVDALDGEHLQKTPTLTVEAGDGGGA